MTVTDIIKHKKVREFLLENFPKPIVDRKEIFSEMVSIENKNPSLTGNAFEFFLRVLSAKFKVDLENEKSIALSNIRQTLDAREEENYKGYVRINLDSDDYEIKIKQIKKILDKKTVLIEDVSKKFKYAVIENIKDVHIWNKIYTKTNIGLGGGELDIIFATISSHIWGDTPPYTVILDKNSLGNFIEKTIKKIETESCVFTQKRELNKDFVELILEFTQISCQSVFFRMINPSKGFHFEKSYLDYVFRLFNMVYQRKDIHKKSLLHHPTLKYSGILATPDFLIEDKILEIKTSKEFFSTDDYLQALIYIILSQDNQNKKRWGIIKEIEIFYPVYNRSIVIKMKENNDKIKPVLKFLKEYSTDEPKVRLNQLKAQMVKVQKKKSN